MVKINKTPLPEGITITCDDDYRTEPLFSIVRSDFHDKCYICESKGPISINIEHRVAHQGNLTVKYDWNNLFYSCSHCNDAKNRYFNEIIDCTRIDPEEYISLEIKVYPKETVKIGKVKDTPGVDKTIDLLNRVYNGISRDMLKAECDNLRNQVQKELLEFQEKLYSYFDEYNVELKEEFRKAIKRMILRKSQFAAFKRKIIRDNSSLFKEFGEYLT